MHMQRRSGAAPPMRAECGSLLTSTWETLLARLDDHVRRLPNLTHLPHPRLRPDEEAELIVILRVAATILVLTFIALLARGPLLALEHDQRVFLAVGFVAALLTGVITIPASVRALTLWISVGLIVISGVSGCWLSADLIAGARPDW